MLQAGLWVRLHFFHFADLDLAVFLNADPDTPLKKLCKNYLKEFSVVKKDEKDCSEVKTYEADLRRVKTKKG